MWGQAFGAQHVVLNPSKQRQRPKIPLCISSSYSHHRNFDAAFFGKLNSLWVARIGVAGDAHTGVAGEDALKATSGGLGAVGDDDLPGVKAVADAHAAAMMEADPGGAVDGVDQRVENRPIGDGVRAVAHGFGFAVGAGYGAAVKMIAANDDGGADFTGSN